MKHLILSITDIIDSTLILQQRKSWIGENLDRTLPKKRKRKKENLDRKKSIALKGVFDVLLCRREGVIDEKRVFFRVDTEPCERFLSLGQLAPATELMLSKSTWFWLAIFGSYWLGCYGRSSASGYIYIWGWIGVGLVILIPAR
ncbi:hypothetical protein NE237_015849 [Protea cynaroides]|uniref:Uncharacterized protein n=1 Tax=Protea cynaroides TaxID=273540 RepID=A0A9Q0QRH2_9MAGN|nr:hypothetical protein NE237_015849 [Protea cynaroides]